MLEHAHATPLARMIVDLDSLLDTRLGTIAKLGKETYAKVIKGGYISRLSDHFDGVDEDQYFELYRQRDSVTLSGSMMTHITSLIRDFVHRVNITSASSPVKMVPRVDINIYPYKVPDTVIKMIIKCLLVHIQDKVNIDHVSYSPQDLHYTHIKHTYDHMVMYDITSWLEEQIPEWEKLNRGLPDVTVFTPILSRQRHRKDVGKAVIEEAEEVSKILAPVLNLMQIPVQFFSSILDTRSLKVSPEAEAPGESDKLLVDKDGVAAQSNG